MPIYSASSSGGSSSGSGSSLAHDATPQLAAQIPAMQGQNQTAPGADVAEYIRLIVTRKITVNRVLLRITTSSGNIDVGVYDDDGPSGAPGTRLASSGSVACPAAGDQAVALSAEVTLEPGRPWAAFAVDNATAAFRFGKPEVGGVGLSPVRFQESAAFPLPATAAATEEPSGNMFMVTVGRA